MKKSFVYLMFVVVCIFIGGAGAILHAGTIDTFYQVSPSNTGPTGNTVWRMESPNSGPDPYGYIRYMPNTPFALSTLTVLSVDFNAVQGPFTGGSPRFDIGLDFDNDGNFDWTGGDRLIYAYWGTQPWGGGTPPTGWTNTGNFVANSFWGPITFFDGNTQYSWTQLVSAFGSLNIYRIYVSLDSGWAGTTQILDVDNFTINGEVYRASVPEPSLMLLLGLGLGTVSIAALRKRK